MPETYTDPTTLTPSARATGVCRRLRALAWMGHAPGTVAARYGLTDGPTVLMLMDLCNHGVSATFGRNPFRTGGGEFPVDVWYAIALAYDDLSMTFGPSAHYRRLAEKNRWTPPLGWDDDALDDIHRQSNRGGHGLPREQRVGYDHAVVRRRINGDHSVHMRPADAREAIRVLHGRGMSDPAIADALGMWVRQVNRFRAELGLAPHPQPGGPNRSYVPGLLSRAKGVKSERRRAERAAAAAA